MISSKKLSRMASKWETFASIKTKNVSLPRNVASDSASTSSPAQKGHFVVYTADQKRFLFPLEYLNKNIFRELLKLSEEEFGLERDGPITLTCDASLMEYIVMVIESGASKAQEKALLMSVVSTCCSSLPISHGEQTSQQVLVCGH